MMRQKRTRTRGMTGYKVKELLTGLIEYPAMHYTGYGDPAAEQREIEYTEPPARPYYHRSGFRHVVTRYSRVGPFIGDGMEADWNAHREALLRFWISGEYSTSERLRAAGVDVRMPPWLFFRGCAGTRPWAWWQFDAPEPLPEGEDETDFLDRHGLLTNDERAELAQED